MSNATANTPDPHGLPQAPQLRWARDSAEIELALGLRQRVFCDEQGVSVSEERDALDDRAMHMVAVGAAGEVVGTLRLVVCNELARVGRIAVDAGWRRRGVASAMIDRALQEALMRGCREARLAAQVRAVALYEQAGFRTVSEHFQEAGIAHVWMRRALV